MHVFTKGEVRVNKAQKPIEILNQGLDQISAENQKISEKIAANKNRLNSDFWKSSWLTENQQKNR